VWRIDKERAGAGGKISVIKLTAQCLVHCAVLIYYDFSAGTIIIYHVCFLFCVSEAI
jgi:hypothetical protein